MGLDLEQKKSMNSDSSFIRKKILKSIKLMQDEINKIKAFCSSIKVDWGRLDFMRRDGELVFLEYNANGQWMFLDYHEEDGILTSVLDYLLPNSH